MLSYNILLYSWWGNISFIHINQRILAREIEITELSSFLEQPRVGFPSTTISRPCAPIQMDDTEMPRHWKEQRAIHLNLNEGLKQPWIIPGLSVSVEAVAAHFDTLKSHHRGRFFYWLISCLEVNIEQAHVLLAGISISIRAHLYSLSACQVRCCHWSLLPSAGHRHPPTGRPDRDRWAGQ